jgi:hypothetical protein
MRTERLARGWSLREFAAHSGVNVGQASQVENGKRPPTRKLAARCDTVFPGRRGWFTNFYEESRTWMPPGFRDWTEVESTATWLRAWSPGTIHGLLQTQDYARTFLETVPGVAAPQVAARLKARMERQQRILYRDAPPAVWFVVDELSLYRCARSPQVMAGQMGRLSEVASLPHVTLQVLPAVEHPAGASELIVTDGAAYVEHLAGGLVFTDSHTVSVLDRLFDSLRGECYKVSESARRIRRLGETWTALGEQAATAAHRADHASR